MSSHKKTIQYLYNLQYSGIKLGLNNVSNLLKYWDNPQKNWSAIHIAGTNGKGSTAAFVHSVLQAAGYQTGLYTSPHLVDFSERIRINDEHISWDTIVSYTEELRPVIEELKPTFFEATTAIAFRYFAERKVDIAVIETGLGGRLDATNLVHPLAIIITPISIDHEFFLGKDIRNIAAEKAGIIKEKIPCFTNNTDPEIIDILRNKCRMLHAPFYLLNSNCSIKIEEENIYGSTFTLKQMHGKSIRLKTSLAGNFQVRNAALAVMTLLNLPVLKINENHLSKGISTTFWSGRMQVIKQNPLTILDVAHNYQSFRDVLEFLCGRYPEKDIYILIGLSKDKDFKKIADLIKRYSNCIGVIENFSERSLPAKELYRALNKGSGSYFIFDTIREGYQDFSRRCRLQDILLITGSHYLAGEFLQKIQKS